MFYKMMRKARNNQKGFTLVELMVVVVIIGILTAVAVPVYNSVTDNANRKAVMANLRTIDGAIMMYQSNTSGGTPVQADLEGAYLQSWPSGPDGVTYSIGGTPLVGIATKGATTGAWFGAGPYTTATIPAEWKQ
ncbi:MAG: type II secretion system protein [Bacillota bacterium]